MHKHIQIKDAQTHTRHYQKKCTDLTLSLILKTIPPHSKGEIEGGRKGGREGGREGGQP